AASWSAAHWKIATFGWLGFVTVAFVLGNAVGSHRLALSDSGNGESGRASQTLAGAGFRQPAGETVLVQSRRLTATDAAFRLVVGGLVSGISKAPHVTDVHTPFDTRGQISRDGRSAIIRFEIAGKTET